MRLFWLLLAQSVGLVVQQLLLPPPPLLVLLVLPRGSLGLPARALVPSGAASWGPVRAPHCQDGSQVAGGNRAVNPCCIALPGLIPGGAGEWARTPLC